MLNRIKRILKIAIPILVLAALAFLCIYMVWQDYGKQYEYAIMAFVGGLIVSFPICTVFHELGHMFFGAICRFKVVPDFRLFRPSSCKLMPQCSKGTRSRMILITLGGLLFNFIFVALGIIALTIPQVPTYLSILLPYSAYLIVLNGIPTFYADGKSDALVAKQLIFLDDDGKVMIAVLKAQAMIYEGKSIKDMHELLFSLPQIAEDMPEFIALTELRAEYYEEVGDSLNAQKQRDRLEDLKIYM